MKASIELEIQPVAVPDTIRLAHAGCEPFQVKVNQLDAAVLSAIAEDFREQLFAKAGIADPLQSA